MKKSLALILACCLVLTGCGPVPERFEDSGESFESSYGSSNEISDSSDNESSSETSENSSSSGTQGSTSSSAESKEDPQSSSTSSSSISSSKPLSSSSSSSSSSSKPQSSASNPSSKPSSSSTASQSKPQSSSSASSITPSSGEIIGNYGRRAQEAWEIEFADEVFRLVNVERVKYGLPEFKKMQKLTESATVRAWECIVNYGHKRPDGQSFSTALTEQGIKFNACGENIAAGQTTPQQVVDAWMNSPGHRSNILSEQYDYDYLGVGFYYDKDGIGGSYRYYWAQNFCSLS